MHFSSPRFFLRLLEVSLVISGLVVLATTLKDINQVDKNTEKVIWGTKWIVLPEVIFTISVAMTSLISLVDISIFKMRLHRTIADFSDMSVGQINGCYSILAGFLLLQAAGGCLGVIPRPFEVEGIFGSLVDNLDLQGLLNYFGRRRRATVDIGQVLGIDEILGKLRVMGILTLVAAVVSFVNFLYEALKHRVKYSSTKI